MTNRTGPTIEELEDMLNAYNEHDIEAVMGYFADDAVFDAAAGPDVHGARMSGKDAIRAAISNAMTSVDSLHYTPIDTRIDGDKAYCELRRTSTSKSGELADFLMVDVLTYREGLIVHKNTFYKVRAG